MHQNVNSLMQYFPLSSICKVKLSILLGSFRRTTIIFRIIKYEFEVLISLNLNNLELLHVIWFLEKYSDAHIIELALITCIKTYK